MSTGDEVVELELLERYLLRERLPYDDRVAVHVRLDGVVPG